MTRKFYSTRKFDKQFKSLDPKVTKQAAKTMELFLKDPAHPSLHFKKVQGTGNFYEIRVDLSVRIIIEIIIKGKGQINIFYIIGKHEEVLPVE